MADVFLKFRYNERDIADALRLRLRGRRRRIEILLVGMLLLSLTLASELVRAGSWRAVVWLLISGLGIVLVFVIVSRVVVPKMLFRRSDLRSQMGVDASEEGITVTAGDRATTIRWAELARVESDERVCALHHGTRVLLIPRRIFRSPKQERSFLELLERFAQASRENRRFESGKSTPSAIP